jgi:hypothetical protein
MTLDEIKSLIDNRVRECAEGIAEAEADGYAEYDYLEGLFDAYSITQSMLNKLIKEDK